MTRWEPYLWSPTPTATDAQIAAVEDVLGVTLPAGYVAIARGHQGESPEPGGMRVGGRPRTVECLLHFRADEYRPWYLPGVATELRDRLPAGVHPVATTTSGTFVAVDADGTVVHVDPDEEPDDEPDDDSARRALVVAPDFEAFLAGLVDPDDPS